MKHLLSMNLKYNKQIVRCHFDRCFMKRTATRHLSPAIVVEQNQSKSLIYMRIPIELCREILKY